MRSGTMATDGSLDQAMDFHVQGRLAEAEALYREVLRDRPDSVPALQGLGVVSFQAGRPDEAAALFERGLAIRPRSVGLHANLGEALRVLKRLDEALEQAQAALALDRQNAEAWNLLGLVARDRRCLDDAESAYRKAIRINPRFAAAYLNLGLVLQARRRWDEAEDVLRTALEIEPDSPLGLTLLGRALSELGDAEALEEAEWLCREAIRLQPRSSVAHLNLGIALDAGRRGREAVASLRTALELDGDDALAMATLGRTLVRMGDIDGLDEAESLCRRAVDRAPDCAEVVASLGVVLRAQGRFQESLACYERALELDPGWAEPRWDIGALLEQIGKYDGAAEFYKAAQALDGDMARYHAGFGSLAARRDRFDEAARHYELALSYDPDDPEAHLGLGLARREQGRSDEAEGCYREAMRLDPTLAVAWVALARLQAERGDFDLACRSSRAALAARPGMADAYCHLASTLKARTPDPEVEAMQGLLEHPYLPHGARASLHFALAGVMEARGQLARSAALLEAANALQADVRLVIGPSYHPDQYSRLVDRVIGFFTAEFLAVRRGWVAADPRPVFVVGPPRSGTTLVEQVLASHPEVHGAGELHDACDVLDGLPALVGRPAVDPLEALAALEPAQARAASRRYLERLEALAPPSAARVVDKMPENILLLGLIGLLWPGARVIVCRRDDRDVALSCWKTNFAAVSWANDPEWIARRLADYRRLLEHWERTRPVEWLDVRYEDLVGDLEGQARRMIAFNGLDWSPACLEFHSTRRVVRTASLEQVRQPLYSHAVGRWRDYERLIPSLFQALGRHGLAGQVAP